MLTSLVQKKDAFVKKCQRFFTPGDVTKISQSVIMAGTAIMTSPMFVMADVNINGMFQTLIGTVCQIFFYIGAILLVWSIGQLVLAFKNEDADSKSRAIMVLVCSLLLMSVKTIYNQVAPSNLQAGTSPIG